MSGGTRGGAALRPIITSLAFILGVLPVAYSAARALRRSSVGTGVMGALAATFLAIFVPMFFKIITTRSWRIAQPRHQAEAGACTR
jgi:multidrug efflux pump subunit AcrB